MSQSSLDKKSPRPSILKSQPAFQTGGRTIILADQPGKTVKTFSDLIEEDTKNVGMAFNFEPGEELLFIHLNEERTLGVKILGVITKPNKFYFDVKKNYVVYSNKYLHMSLNAGKEFKKVSLDAIVKVENLPGMTRGSLTYKYLIRCTLGVTGQEKGLENKTPRASTRQSTVLQRNFDIDLYSETALKFFLGKLTSMIEARENIVLRNLRVDILRREVRRFHRKGPPARRANDLTDALYVGWLEKAGKLNTQWKKRYVVLAGEWVFYFHSATADRQRGAIDLFPHDCFVEKEEAKGEFSISTMVPAPEGSRKLGTRRKFVLRLADGKDGKERDVWFAKLNEQKKMLKARWDLRKLAAAGGTNPVDKERERERLTKRILSFVHGDNVTGPLQSVCSEWRDWYGGIGGPALKESDQTPKLIIDIGTSVWKVGISKFDKKRPDAELPVTPYADDNFKKVHKKRLEQSFKQVFSELKINPIDCFVFITKPFKAHTNWQKTMTGLLFDTFQFRAMHVEAVPCCIATAYDRGTLLVVDVGSKAARVSPVVDYHFMEAVSSEFAHLSHDGPTMEILSWLCSRANKLGLTPPQATELARSIKSNYVSCHLSNKHEFDKYMASHGSKPQSKIEEMKDAVVCQVGGVGGRKFKIPKHVLLRAGELLWRPKDVLPDTDPTTLSLPEAVLQVAEAAGAGNLGLLLSNIALCGGGAQMKGFSERLTFELEAILGLKKQQALTLTDVAATDAVRLTYSLESSPDTIYAGITPNIIHLKDYDDLSDLVWVGANKTAAQSPADSADFWAPNTAYKLEDEYDSEHDAENSDDEDEE